MTDRIQTLGSERFTVRIQSLGAERLMALLIIIFAVAELYAAMQLSMTEEFTLGPGALPAIYAVGLLIFAIALAIWPSQKTLSVAEITEANENLPPRNYRDGLLTFGLVTLFIASIYFIGFLGGTVIFSVLYVRLVTRWPVVKALTFGLLWGGGVYYGFDHLLGVQLEPGILFGG